MTSAATLATLTPTLARLTGPVALVLAEDAVALPQTVAHLLARGFAHVIVALPDGLDLHSDAPQVLTLRMPTRGPGAMGAIVNPVVAALPAGTWLHLCWNAEFLIYPVAETRSIAELLAFHDSERRVSMPTTLVDLFPADPGAHPDGVDLDTPRFDTAGMTSRTRDGTDRNVDILGGTRWRLGLAPSVRRVDRYGLVRTAPGLRLSDDHLWSDPERNTLSCPWHRNTTACLVSYRLAKTLLTAPGGAQQWRGRLNWHGAQDFDWRSETLLQAGLMEMGQWF